MAKSRDERTQEGEEPESPFSNNGQDDTIDARGVIEAWARKEIESRGTQLPDDDEFREKYKTIWEFFAADRVAGDYLRHKPVYTVTQDDGCWRLTFTDRDLKKTITVTCLKHADLMDTLEKSMKHLENWSSIRSRSRGLRKASRKEG